jgi:hypothetical protein
MIYRPRRPAIWDRADLSDPLTRDLKGLWCFQTGHHNDLSGVDNRVTTSVNPTWDSRGVTWNKNGYFDFGNNASFGYADSGATSGFSLECVFQLDSTVNGEQQRLVSKMGVIPFVGSHGFELMVRAPDDGTPALRNRICFRIANTGTDGPYNGTTEIIVGRRYHVLITKAPGSTNPSIYLDGVLDSATPGVGIANAIPSTSTSFYIGAAPLTNSYGIRGAIEKVAVYGRQLSAADVSRLALDSYCHFGARRVFLFAGGAEVGTFFDWDLSHGATFEALTQTALFDLTAASECEWTAPQPIGAILTIDPRGDIDFTGTGSRVGRFDASAPETSAQFSGRQRGPVIWTVNQATRCSWLVGGNVVKKDCLAGDARWIGEAGDTDLERNYVF